MKCLCCGSDLLGKRKDAKHCSDSCQIKMSTKRAYIKRVLEREKYLQPKPCKECSTLFIPSLRSIKTQVFCSENCRMVDYYRKRKERGRKDDFTSYPPDRKRRTIEYNRIYRRNKSYGGNGIKALERDDYKCKACGTVEGLHVHHIDFSGQTENPNNDMSNLITLCRSCHAKIHFTDHIKKHGANNTKFISKEEIIEALNGRTVEEAARMLDIDRGNLLKKRKEYGIELRR